jgi:hypothetical protein
LCLKEYEVNVYTAKTPLLDKGKSTFDFIELYYNHYLNLFDNDHYSLTKSFELYNQLELMRFGVEADYWVAPLLRYYEKYKTSELLDFLYLLDRKFSSDWIIGFSPTRRIQNTNEIIKEIETATDQKFLFASPVFKVETQELLRVLSGGIYGRPYCRYILLKIDLAYHGHNTKFSPPRAISIEHILPQTPDSDSQWVKDLALLMLRVDSIPSDGSLEPRNRGNSGSWVFIHSAPSKVIDQVLCRDAVKPGHPRFKAAMVAVNILDVEDRVHFVNLALGRDHPIWNIEVVDKAPEGTTAINA